MQCFPGASEGTLTWVGLEKQPLQKSGLKLSDGKIQKLFFCTPPPSHLTHSQHCKVLSSTPIFSEGWEGATGVGSPGKLSVPSPTWPVGGFRGAPLCVTMWPRALFPMETGCLHQNFQLPALDKENNEMLQRVETRVTSHETDSPLGQSPAPGQFPEP